MRMAGKLPDLDPGTMLHGSVVKVDLEPVPDGDGRAGKSQDVLHSAPVIWIWTSRPSMGWVSSKVNAAPVIMNGPGAGRHEAPGRGDSRGPGGSISACGQASPLDEEAKA